MFLDKDRTGWNVQPVLNECVCVCVVAFTVVVDISGIPASTRVQNFLYLTCIIAGLCRTQGSCCSGLDLVSSGSTWRAGGAPCWR